MKPRVAKHPVKPTYWLPGNTSHVLHSLSMK